MKLGRTLLPIVFLLQACAASGSPSQGLTSTSAASSPAASTSNSTTPLPSATPSQAAAAGSQRPPCPNRGGGACLGPLVAGTYQSTNFSPSVTYTVPAGWQNFEDLPGNLSFLPPGADLAGVDAGTSDALGIAASVAVDTPDCAGLPAPAIGRSASAIFHVLRSRPGLVVTNAHTAALGGLKGYRLDLRLAKSWKQHGCTGSSEPPDVPLLVGVPPSDFVNTILGRVAIRLYLLDRNGGTLSVEVDDVSGGSRIASYQPVIDSLMFGD